MSVNPRLILIYHPTDFKSLCDVQTMCFLFRLNKGEAANMLDTGREETDAPVCATLLNQNLSLTISAAWTQDVSVLAERLDGFRQSLDATKMR